MGLAGSQTENSHQRMELTDVSPLCNATNLSNFVLMVHTFRIIVLTYNRPDSLFRLLKSLENSDYSFGHNNPNWNIILEIRVDGGGEKGDRVRKIAQTFRFSHGEKIVQEESENRGIMKAWAEAWTWRDRELFVVIEDDVEMSPHWYRAAVNMWRKYGDREYFGGLGLQNQEFAVWPGRSGVNISDLARDPVYFYEVPSSIGSSPHPCHWARMISLYGHQLGSCPANMSCEQSVWEAWWLKYLQANVLYTLYAAHQEGYAVDHREVGYHHKQKGVSLCRSTVQHWEEERELDNLPLSPDIIDIFLQTTNKLGGYHLKKIKSRAAVTVVRLVESEEDRLELVNRLEVMSEEERLATAVIITREKYRAGLSSVTVLTPHMFDYMLEKDSQNFTMNKILVPVLMEVTSFAQRVLTLPNCVTLKDLPGPEAFKTNIVAGRRPNQKHPRLGTNFLYFDGTYSPHRTMVALYKKYKQSGSVSLDNNFLAEFTNPGLTRDHIKWSWMT